MERVIGIELGHRNCRVAWAAEDAGPQILPNSDNERLTPTAAALHPDGQWLFGAGAVSLEASRPERVARDLVEKFGAGLPVTLGGRQFPADEVLGRLVAWLIASAAERLGGAAARAWVAVPSAWGRAEHGRFAQAVAGAGREVEPVPAVLAAARGALPAGAPEPAGIDLVYDLGGASMAAAVVEIRPDAPPRALASAAHMDIAGRLFDNVIVEYIAVMIQQEHRVDPYANPRFLLQLQNKAREAKHRLGAGRVAEVVILGMLRAADGTPLDVDVEIEREQFERMIEDSVGRSVEIARQCLAQAGVAPEAIGRVPAVGGSSSIPAVRAALAAAFGGGKLLSVAAPGECSALGAAWLARCGLAISLPASPALEDEVDTVPPERELVTPAPREPVEPRAVNPDLSEHLNDVILRALEKNPDRRFQTAQELRDALAAEPESMFRTIVSGSRAKKAAPHA